MSYTVSCAISVESRLDLGSSEDPTSIPLDDFMQRHWSLQEFLELHSVNLVEGWVSSLDDLIFKGA